MWGNSKRRFRNRPGSPNHIDLVSGEHPWLRLRESGVISPKSVLMLSPSLPMHWWMIYNPKLITEQELKVPQLFRQPGDTLRDAVCGAQQSGDRDQHQSSPCFPTVPALLYKLRGQGCCIPPPDVLSFTIHHNGEPFLGEISKFTSKEVLGILGLILAS